MPFKGAYRAVQRKPRPPRPTPMLDNLYTLLGKGSVTREQILSQIYGVRIGRHSARYVKAHKVRMQRLLDRARRRARKVGAEVRFDHGGHSWQLTSPGS